MRLPMTRNRGSSSTTPAPRTLGNASVLDPIQLSPNLYAVERRNMDIDISEAESRAALNAARPSCTS